MTIKEQLQTDANNAIREGNTSKRDALRTLLAAIKQVEVDERKSLDDEAVSGILTKQAKQRRESIADYEKAGRPEQAAQEQFELEIIEHYLPKMMSREEIAQLATAVIAELGVKDVKGLGAVMGKLTPQTKGKADGRLVTEVVKALLQGA